MQSSKTVDGRFLFATDEWMSTNQIRSYFSRLKSVSAKRNNYTSLSSTSQSSDSILSEQTNDDVEEDESSNYEVRCVLF